MTKVNIELFEDIVSVINRIKDINDTGIELEIPQGALIFENTLNLKLLKKEAERLGKTVQISTSDEFGRNMINMLEDNPEDFSITEVRADDELQATLTTQNTKPKGKLGLLGLSRLKNIKLKKGLPKNTGMRRALFIGAVLLLLAGGLYTFIWSLPEAHVRIVVAAQPLVKSTQIRAVLGAQNDATAKQLKGTAVTATVSKTATTPTTGSKLVGDAAEGTVKIYNKTDSEVKLDKGDFLELSDNNDLRFKLKSDVIIPAATKETNENEQEIITPGEKEVDLEAADIGEAYNIEKDEKLEVDGFDDDDIYAKTTEDFTGGKSETVKTVAEADKTTLSSKIAEEVKAAAAEELRKTLVGDRKTIQGAYLIEPSEQAFNHDVGDETEELQLIYTAKVTGLVYSQKDLDELLNVILDEFIPTGFTLSSKDKEINVEVLGSTENTVLSESQSDLQVTIRSYIVPDINEDDLKGKLAGQKLSEAEKILGSIQNVRTYELNVTPSIPLIQKVPTSTENIFIEVVKE